MLVFKLLFTFLKHAVSLKDYLHVQFHSLMLQTDAMRLCHPPDGSPSPKYKLPCIITTKIFCKEKNTLAFNWDRCCHLVLCLWLIPFHLNRNNLAQIVQCHNFKNRNLFIFNQHNRLGNNIFYDKQNKHILNIIILIQIATDWEIRLQNLLCKWFLQPKMFCCWDPTGATL